MKKALYFIAVIALINLVATAVFTYTIKNRLSHSPSPDKLDTLVILFADFTDDYKELGEESIKRLNYAISSSSQYRSASFLCVGGSRPDYKVKGAELMKNYLMDHGIAGDKVFADGNSYDTRTNWSDARRLIKEKNWHSVGIVSSAFHLYRFNNHIIGGDEEFNSFLLPHPLFHTSPQTSFVELWEAVQYEWAAYTAYLLPDAMYKKILSLIRPQ